MAYSFNDDFLNAFRNGGCFIFEGEDGNPDDNSQDNTPTEQQTEEQPTEGQPAEQSTEQPAEQQAQQPAQEQPAQTQSDPNVDATAENQSGSVNTDEDAKAEAKNSPRELAIAFDKAGLRLKVAKKALQQLGITNGNVKLDTRKLDPFFKVALEQYVQKIDQNYTVSAITKAIRMLSDSCGVNAIQKAKEARLAQKKAALKQKQHAEEAKKQQQPQQQEQPAEGGSGGDEAQPQQQEQPADAGDVNAEQ